MSAGTTIPSAPAERDIPAGPRPERIEYGFDRAAIEYDLLTTARSRFGEAAVREALNAPHYLSAKYYPDMVPPPPPDAAPGWRYPEFPIALLMKGSGGEWVVVTPDGFRPARSGETRGIEAFVTDRAFWAEPEWGPPGCTDDGASIFMLKVPDRKEIIRREICGAAPLRERLVHHAIRT